MSICVFLVHSDNNPQRSEIRIVAIELLGAIFCAFDFVTFFQNGINDCGVTFESSIR